jgi:hypothetical protein
MDNVQQSPPPSTGNPPRQGPQNKRTCGQCVFAGWMTTRWPPQLLCVNTADAPGKIREVVPPGTCRNFHARREPPVRYPEPEPPNDKVRYIALTKGMFAIVDAEDYDELMKYRWTAFYTCGKWYAGRNSKGTCILMHRQIMKAPKGKVVDHHNGMSLDNRKANMRLCTYSQNNINRRPRSKTSKYKGVCRDKRRNLWRATVAYKGRSIQVGRYTDELEAARASDYASVQFNGEYAWLNFPEEWSKERILEVYKAAQAARRKLNRLKARQSTTKSTRHTKKTRRRSNRN